MGKRGRQVERDKEMKEGRRRGAGEDRLRWGRDCEGPLSVEFTCVHSFKVGWGTRSQHDNFNGAPAIGHGGLFLASAAAGVRKFHVSAASTAV